MSEEGIRIETLNELRIWLEGEFKLVRSDQKNNAEEMRNLRKTVHDTNNHVSALLALDIPGKLEGLRDEVQSHDNAIDNLIKDQTSLKTTMRTAYIAVGIASAAVGAILTIALRLYEVFGG